MKTIATVLFSAALAAQAAFLPPPTIVRSTPLPNLPARLEWSPSPSAGVVSYNIYMGTESRSYVRAVGSSANFVDVMLWSDRTNYIAGTAVDSWGLESDFSKELACKAASVITVQSEGWLESSASPDGPWVPDVNQSITNATGVKFFRGVNVTIKHKTYWQ